MVFLVLLALFVGIPVVEIATYIKVGGQIGVLGAIGFTFLTAFIGVVLVRWQGLQALSELRRAGEEGRPPVIEMAAGALLALAGILLLIPGFVTDAVGFVLLVPPLRRALAAWLVSRARVAQPAPGVTIIEAEVVDIDEDDACLPRRDDSPWRGGR